MNKNITAVVMAAGFGKRLGALSKDKPKALIEIENRPLIQWALNFLEDPRISKIIVVGGSNFEMLEKAVPKEPKINLVKNSEFHKGNILSLKCGIGSVDSSVLLCNVDHIYPKRILNKVIDNDGKLSAMCDNDRTLFDDDMKVKSDGSLHIKSISKKLPSYDFGYIGMTYCDRTILKKYKCYIDMTIKDIGETASAEDVLRTMAENGEEVSICDCSGGKWLEIDTEEELNRARLEIRSVV